MRIVILVESKQKAEKSQVNEVNKIGIPKVAQKTLAMRSRFGLNVNGVASEKLSLGFVVGGDQVAGLLRLRGRQLSFSPHSCRHRALWCRGFEQGGQTRLLHLAKKTEQIQSVVCVCGESNRDQALGRRLPNGCGQRS